MNINQLKPINKLNPFTKFCCTIGNLPSSYLDSMTYYEQLLWFCNFLEKTIIPTVNGNAEAVQELQNLFVELKNYVDNYFKNLDVQEEINNKLDEMVETGEFSRILNKLLYFNEYNFHTLFATEYYRNNDELFGMQGGCVLPDNSIIMCTGNNNSSTGKILHYGQDGVLLNSKTVDYGHCNGVTYCDKTGTVFITSTQNDTLGRFMIYEINPTTLQEVSVQDLSDKNFPSEPYAIVYVNEIEKFIFCNYWNSNSQKYLWLTDLEFNVLIQNSIDINVRSTSNVGRFGDYIGINVIGSHKVLLFDFNNLEFIKECNINELVSDTWYITEVEWFDTKNGNIFLGFIPHSATSPRNWGGGTKVVAYFNPYLNYQETGKQVSEFPPHQETYYINSSLPLNVKRDGSSSAPFRNIYEALNSALRTKNVTGDVTIYFQNSEENNYSPIFSMNKSYRLYKNFNSTLNCLASLAVAEKAKVFISGHLTLTNGNLIDVFNWKPSHIQNRGILYIDNFVLDSNSERLILSSSSTSQTTFGLNENGLDIEDMYGDFYNLYNGPYSNNNLLIPNNYQEHLMLKRCRNVNMTLSIDETDNSFQLPLYCNVVFVNIRFRLPDGSNATIDREETLIFKPRKI